jgi:hypothetical protein
MNQILWCQRTCHRDTREQKTSGERGGVVWLLYPFIEPSSSGSFLFSQQFGGMNHRLPSDDTTTRRRICQERAKHVQKFKLRVLLVLTYDVSPQLNKHLFTTRTTDRLFLSALLR